LRSFRGGRPLRAGKDRTRENIVVPAVPRIKMLRSAEVINEF